MKTSDFKKLLKPLIKQTIKEVLFEEGVLSGVVAEVAKGLQQPAALIDESKKENLTQKRSEEERQRRIKKLNESSKFGNVFAGTRELKESSHGPLSGVSASDSGVDISAIEKIANGKWAHLIK